jgi:hypothetical protein
LSTRLQDALAPVITRPIAKSSRWAGVISISANLRGLERLR